jgi:uncharacterized protein (TIGR02266 family)
MATGHIAEQIGRAKELIGRALGLMQDFGAGRSAPSASRHMAAAVRSLYEAETNGLTEPTPVARAMDSLRAALGQMQDSCAAHPELEAATASIARALAALFPLLAALAAPAADEAPLPLVRRAPAGAIEAPLPLTRRRAEVPGDGEPLALTPKPRPRVEPAPERRIAVRREAEVEIGIQSDTNFYTGFSCDISSGGIFVATYDVPAIGTEVNVNFQLPGGPVMSLDGAVRWVRDLDPRDPDVVPGMGVAFHALAPAQARAINAFLAVRQPIFYED